MQFRDADAEFDIPAFEHAVRLWTVTLEISVLMAQFPSKEIAQLSYEYRTLGLGFANIGGLLMAAGHSYDSDEGRAICGAISAVMTGIAYATSAEMASEVGSFPNYKKNAKHMLRVMKNHQLAAEGKASGYEGLSILPVPLDTASCPDKALVSAAANAWDKAVSLGKSMATAMHRPLSLPRPAPSALLWIVTQPALSQTLPSSNLRNLPAVAISKSSIGWCQRH